MTRPPGTWPDPGPIYYVPHDEPPVCTYRLDLETGKTCGRPAEYELRIRGYDARAGACAEHAAVVRTHPELERIWSL